ncbi:MAG: hypothetical protein JXD18_15115 [Anaerolineae bacterium]|nr:hypothetical protein [Anaerolineae bacterium]
MRPTIPPRRWLLAGVLLALAAPLPAGAAGHHPGDSYRDADALLRQAFDLEDAEGDRFQPYRGRVEVHSWLHDGDGALEYEAINTTVFVQWTPDSTENLEETETILFEKEDGDSGEENGEEGGEEDDGEEGHVAIAFLSAAHRDAYRFKRQGEETRDGRRLVAYSLRPHDRGKKYWEGTFWLEADTGHLAGFDLAPSKRRFGLHAMRMRMDFAVFAGLALPVKGAMDLEIKIRFIVHKKVRTTMEFGDYALVGAGG